MSDYICEKCGNDCELEDVYYIFDDSINFEVSACCRSSYYEKEDEL